jgi:hypothetical protein
LEKLEILQKRLPDEPTRVQEVYSYISKAELLRLLDRENATDILLQRPETDSILRTGRAMKMESQIRAEWLMKSEQVTRWFRAHNSRTMLINGNHIRESISPVSFFCAMLIRSLKLLGPVVVTGHFCGLHLGLDDELAGGYGLLKNLTTQLMAQWHFGDLTCFNQDQADVLRDESEEGLDSLQTLWQLFRSLITALPPKTPVFIIVDGISFYETEGRSLVTNKVISKIHSLATSEKVKAMVKVLVTSPIKALSITQVFWEDERVLVPTNPPGVRFGFSDSQFNKGFGKNVKRLEQASHQSLAALQ